MSIIPSAPTNDTTPAPTRESLLAAVGFNDAANTGSTPEELIDAYRLAVIADRDAQIIAWLEKKAGEEGTSNKERRTRANAIYRMADKLSRGAVRPPLSGAPTPPQENYSGELAMLRGLLSVLQVVAKHGDMAEVQRLLAEHAADEKAAYTEDTVAVSS